MPRTSPAAAAAVKAPVPVVGTAVARLAGRVAGGGLSGVDRGALGVVLAGATTYGCAGTEVPLPANVDPSRDPTAAPAASSTAAAATNRSSIDPMMVQHALV
ncbi:hypothetical protein Voc01_003350 [Virgisporangium ochraceum]|uniref:Uncharacterized protein n=1 Tax=Virgisporangium ochraceum TaxID=65505 RepID=A0A8J3ZMA9_9ACTN|nr:hypothetical protein Voc01_003350 [Virgisporangium ochraceum]